MGGKQASMEAQNSESINLRLFREKPGVLSANVEMLISRDHMYGLRRQVRKTPPEARV